MKVVVPNSLIFHSDNLVEKIPGLLKTVEPYLLNTHYLKIVPLQQGYLILKGEIAWGLMLLQLVILDFKKRPPLFFLVNLTYKFNKTAETTQYKFSKKKELTIMYTIMYPKFHKDNFIRSILLLPSRFQLPPKFSHIAV